MTDGVGLEDLVRRYRALLDSSLDMVVAVDRQRRIVEFNAAAERQFGYRRQEVLGRSVDLLYADAEAEAEVHRRLDTDGSVTAEIVNRRRDGTTFPASLSAAPMRDADGRLLGWMGVSRDTTAERRALDDLQVDLALQRLRNRILTMTGPDDWEGVVAALAAELSSLIDFNACSINLVDEAEGRVVAYGSTPAHGAIRIVVDGVGPVFRLATDTGQPVYRPTRAHPLFAHMLPPEVRAIVDAPFDGGTLAVNSTREHAFDEGDLRVLVRFAAVVGEGSRRLRDLVTLALREQQLRRAQRLEALGQLATGVAHEINNPLTAVTGYCELALRHDLPPALRAHVEAALQAGRQAQGIASRLLRFANNQRADRQSLHLDPLVTEALDLAARRLQVDGVRLERQLEPRLPLVEGHPGQLQELLLGLVENARQAITGSGVGGCVTVRTLLRDGWVCLEVQDDGPGIPPEVGERVFDPFYTTKRGEGGSGLGLSLCDAIARDHGGRLRLGRPEKGALLVLDLPPTTPQSGPGPSPPS